HFAFVGAIGARQAHHREAGGGPCRTLLVVVPVPHPGIPIIICAERGEVPIRATGQEGAVEIIKLQAAPREGIAELHEFWPSISLMSKALVGQFCASSL